MVSKIGGGEYGCGRLRDDHDEYAGPGYIGSNGFCSIGDRYELTMFPG